LVTFSLGASKEKVTRPRQWTKTGAMPNDKQRPWIPAFAGMTARKPLVGSLGHTAAAADEDRRLPESAKVAGLLASPIPSGSSCGRPARFALVPPSRG
jgi:hypothetical protein